MQILKKILAPINVILSVNNPLQLIWKGLLEIKKHYTSSANISVLDALMVVIEKAAHHKQTLQLVMDILPLYDMKVDSILRVGNSVNTVYKVDAEGTSYALRIHPSNNHSTETIQAELQWLTSLGTTSTLMVPEPVTSRNGKLVQEVPFLNKSNFRQAVLFRWLDGEALGNNLTPKTMKLAGSFIAELHQNSKKFTFSNGLSRQHICWGELRIWLNNDSYKPEILTQKDYSLCVFTAKAIFKRIDNFLIKTDYGLIHRDLTPYNLLLCKDKIAAIDFDDCIYGPFLYDMATPLSYLQFRKDYKNLKFGFLQGYANIRQIPLHYEIGLDLFIAARAHYIIDWIISLPALSFKSFGPELLASSLKSLRKYQASHL